MSLCSATMAVSNADPASVRFDQRLADWLLDMPVIADALSSGEITVEADNGWRGNDTNRGHWGQDQPPTVNQRAQDYKDQPERRGFLERCHDENGEECHDEHGAQYVSGRAADLADGKTHHTGSRYGRDSSSKKPG